MQPAPLAQAFKGMLIRNESEATRGSDPSSRIIDARIDRSMKPTTEFGYCVHDFSMLPCQLHRDCLSCPEQVCVKGGVVREANVRRLRNETRQLLAEAVAAESDQYNGANRWVDHQRQTLARLDGLCAIFDDPSIPPGTVIQAAKAPGASRLEQAAGDRARGTADLRVPGAMLPALPPRGLRTPGPAAKKSVRA